MGTVIPLFGNRKKAKPSPYNAKCLLKNALEWDIEKAKAELVFYQELMHGMTDEGNRFVARTFAAEKKKELDRLIQTLQTEFDN